MSILLKKIDNNISAIKLLVQYTRPYLLWENIYNPILFVQIVKNPKIFDAKEIDELYFSIKNQWGIDYYNYIDDDKEKLYNQLQDGLISSLNKENTKEVNEEYITSVFNILCDIDPKRFYNNIEKLLIKSIRKQNIILPSLLLKNGKKSFDHIFNIYVKNKNKNKNKNFFQTLQDAPKNYRDSFEKNLGSYFSGKPFLVPGFTINYIPIFDSSLEEYEENIRQMEAISMLIHETYKKNQDKDELKKKFGFQNNEFHFWASKYFSLTGTHYIIDDKINYKINYKYDAYLIDINIDICLNSKNAFNQTPLDIALLRKNQNFLDLFYNKVKQSPAYKKDNPYYDDKISEIGNKIGLILAKLRLDKKFIEENINKLKNIGINIFDINSSKNNFEHHPAYEAVRYRNYPFLFLWIKEADVNKKIGMLDITDRDGSTLWHEFAKTTSYKSKKKDKSYIKIILLLKQHIGSLFNNQNNFGIIPIQLAILYNPRIFRLLLQKKEDLWNKLAKEEQDDLLSNGYDPKAEDKEFTIDLNHKDLQGNRIGHLMAQQFKKKSNKHDIDLYKSRVEVLIENSLFDKIKDLYNEKNILNQTPIEIIEEGIENKLPVYVHAKVSIDLLQRVGRNLGAVGIKYNSKSSSVIDPRVSVKFPEEYKYDKQGIKNQEFDNNVMFFRSKVLEEINKVDMLSKHTRNVIYGLLPEIIYGNVNPNGDKLYHVLVSRRSLMASTAITLFHILKEIENIAPELIKVVYSTPNSSGQLLAHLAILFNRNNILKFGLEYYPDLIDQEAVVNSKDVGDIASKLGLSEETVKGLGFYPADYAILLENNEAINKLISFSEKNNKLIRCNIPIDYLTKDQEKFSNYLWTTDKLQDIDYKVLKLMCLQDVAVELKDRFINDMNYFPLMPADYPLLLKHVNLLIKQNNILNIRNQDLKIYEKQVEFVDSFFELSDLLQIYKKELSNGNNQNYPNKLIPIVLSSLGHTNAVVVVRDTNNKFHAFIQDSQTYPLYKEEPFMGKGLLAMKAVLQQRLSIDNENIHNLNIEQQGINDSTCVLWSIANVKIIEFSLLKMFIGNSDDSIWNRMGCLRICNEPLKDFKISISEGTLIMIKNNINKYVPSVVSSLENFAIKACNSELTFNPSEEGVRQHINDVIKECTGSIECSKKKKYEYDIEKYLSKGDYIFDLIKKLDKHKIFDLDNNTNEIQIIDESEAIQYLNKVKLESLKNKKNARITFIIRTLENQWYTLVVIYDNNSNSYRSYYASPGIINVSEPIREHLNTYSIPIDIVLYTTQSFNIYDYVFFAIQNAFDINIILNDKNIRANFIDKGYDLYDVVESLEENMRSPLKSSSDFNKVRKIIYNKIKDTEKDTIKFEDDKSPIEYVSSMETDSPSQNIKKIHENYMNKKLTGSTVLYIIEKLDKNNKNQVFNFYGDDVNDNTYINNFNQVIVVENHFFFVKELKKFVKKLQIKT